MIKVESDAHFYIMSANEIEGATITADYFDPQWLKTKNLVDEIKTGRGEVCFFSLQGRQFALRQYFRGGLVARVNKRRFLWKNIKSTRVYSELSLLDYMHTNGLNVPLPLAGRVEKSGATYQAAIITEIIPNANELHQLLLNTPVSEDIWRSIGKSIKQMHDLDVCHDDINVKNVLIDDKERIFLIDFDKCERKSSGSWKEKNIARFKRSLDKQSTKHQGYAFTPNDWAALEQGYSDAR